MDANIYQLLSDLIDQRLDEWQAAELNELLRSQPEVAEVYMRMLRIHQSMVELESPVRPFSLEELRAVKAVEDHFNIGIGAASEEGVPTPLGPRHRRMRFPLIALAVAATVLLALFISSGWLKEREEIAQDSSAAEHAVVARIVRKIDCDWEQDRWIIAPSTSILAGQKINLSRGLLTLEFESGAELTLDGPVNLVATSGKSAKLVAGKLSARVPPRGRGFTIETHAGDFIDLGTEFGMIVGRNGGVQTHVFKGKVVAEAAVDKDTKEGLVLETGAAWARRSNGAAERLNARPELFVLPNFAADMPMVSSPPVDRGLTLWYRASDRVQQDRRGNISAWGDLRSPENQTVDDAWQVTSSKRPRWKPDAIGGQPALGFNGYKSLVTEPIHLGVNHTSVVVFRTDLERAREIISARTEYQHLGVQLLNLNGPPHTVLQVNDDARLEGRVHLGWVRDLPDPVDVGFIRSDSGLDESPHIAIYTYDAVNSVARLYVDGVLLGESNDVREVGTTTSPRYLGSHYDREGFGFAGDIAEIMVFDSAFSNEEVERVSSWLGDRYQIDIAEGQQADSLGRKMVNAQ
jgi:hypothetical protein